MSHRVESGNIVVFQDCAAALGAIAIRCKGNPADFPAASDLYVRHMRKLWNTIREFKRFWGKTVAVINKTYGLNNIENDHQ